MRYIGNTPKMPGIGRIKGRKGPLAKNENGNGKRWKK